MSPALAGGFLTTVPPGKPNMTVFKMQVLWYDWEHNVSIRKLQEMKMDRRVRTDSA